MPTRTNTPSATLPATDPRASARLCVLRTGYSPIAMPAAVSSPDELDERRQYHAIVVRRQPGQIDRGVEHRAQRHYAQYGSRPSRR